KTIVLLLIYNEDDLLIGKDRVELQDVQNESANNNDKGIEIAGLISDETKTKVGKDFYELYFKKYNEASINGTEIVTIEEELNFGRTTKIKIYISNVLISEFITFPDEDFLQFKAEDAVLKTKKYFKDSQNNKRYVTQY
ncbi:MAG: CsgE family curli-type amyloid fiber assembly protein, partial [Flavobacterium sp.]